MRIAFFINDISAIGGTERVTTQIANGLHKMGHSITIFSVYQENNDTYFPIDPRIELICLFHNPTSFSQSLYKAPLKLRKALLDKRIDLIIGSDSQTGPIVALSTFATSTRGVIWEHFNASQETFLGSRWLGRRVAALFLSFVIVLTNEDRKLWLRKYICRAKIKTIPNPCAYPLLKSKNVLGNRTENIVLAAGRYTNQKGFDLLVSAWSLLPIALRNTWTLKIVGPNGSAKPHIQELIDANHLHDSIQLCDTVRDMKNEYTNAKLFVSSSRYEGFGLTIIEAMSQGLPVIAFDCPMGPGEILQQDYGVLVPKEDVIALSGALTELLTNSEILNYYAEQALVRSKAYQEPGIIEQWQSTITSLKAH